MDYLNISELIKVAISDKKELNLKLKTTSNATQQEVRFCPYIYGEDTLNFKFIWGYLPQFQTFYSLPVQQIEAAEPVRVLYSAFPNAKYLKPQGEEHYCVLEGGWKYIS